jgi:ribonuclease P protein subunit RPR2
MRWRKKRTRLLAREHIQALFELADEVYHTDPERSHRYVEIARTISMRTRTRMPYYFKRRYCKNCHHFLVYGKNCRVRTKNMKLVITCLDCGHITRVPFVREKKTITENKKKKGGSV